MQHAEAAKTNWLTLLRNGGERDLGAGLVRLATLAAAVHQQEVARQAMHLHEAQLADEGRAEGSVHGSVVGAAPMRGAASRSYTEVRR